VQNQVQDAPWASLDNMTDGDQGLDLWGFLQRRKSFVILLAIVGAGLGYLYFQRQVPRFSSNALLQVIHHSSDPRVEGMMAERNLSDAQFVITSPMLLVPCVKKYNLSELNTLRGMTPDAAARRIAGMVNAHSLAANILQLTCTGPDANDTAVIANAVSKEFIDHQKESYQDAVSKLEGLLTEAKNVLLKSVSDKETAYATFDATSPLMSDGANVHRERLTAINSKISGLFIQQTELGAELQGLEEASAKGGQREALLLLVGKQSERTVGETPEGVEQAVTNAKSMFQALMPLLMEEAILGEELGAGHPKLVALRRRIEITQSHLDKLAGLTPKRNESTGKQEPRPDFLTVYLSSLRNEMLLLDSKRKELQNLADTEEAAAKGLRVYEHKRMNHEREIARENSLLQDIQAQIRDTELPTNIGGISATILTEARHGSLVFPKLTEFLGLGAFLGAFVGLGLGYLVEVADRSFRKPEEIIREFGVPILGHIPYMQEQNLRKIPKGTMDRTIISLHQPRSRPAEAYRSVRTAVCFSALGSKHRVIQVTSPAAGDGKSTLTMNFAVSLAQSGKRTVILESDFRRPKVHKLTGVDNSIGVVDVLRGDAELSDAIHETELEGFYVIPCGSRPKNPSELITRPEYELLLETLREKFDYVIIDTPPVLVVTDPCSVAPRVDGVLLCVRLSRHTRDFGRRALEQLRDVGANMTGIVINGVEETDAYGYGSYSYSDYRYQYKDYSYTYGAKGDEAYFADAELEEASK
jgi:polysaccharide biosynthesis transport protein